MYNNNPYMNNRSYQQLYPQYPQNNYNYMQQPIVQQVQEPQLQGIKFLNAEQIKAYIVLPNTKEILVDKDNKLAYVMSADNMGNSNTQKFSYTDLNEPKVEEKQSEIDMSQYVKITDLDKFAQKKDLDGLLSVDSIKSLENKIQALESRLNAKKEISQISDEA